MGRVKEKKAFDPSLLARLAEFGNDEKGIQGFNRTVFGSELHPGQLKAAMLDKPFSIVSPGNSWGKMLRDDEPVPTPDGWTTHGELKPGDKVFDWSGDPVTVTEVFPQPEQQFYRFTFNDGTEIESGEEHLWVVRPPAERWGSKQWRTLTTKEIAQKWGNPKNPKQRVEFPVCDPVEIPPREFVLEPYHLGLILGDGCVRKDGSVSFTCHNDDREIVPSWATQYGDQGYGLPGLAQTMRELGLAGKRSWEKKIPQLYMRNFHWVRLELLRGLMDTDGSISKGNGQVEYCTTSPHLAEQVAELVYSMGGSVRTSERYTSYVYQGEKRLGRKSFRLKIRIARNPFKLRRKADLWEEFNDATNRTFNRLLVSAEPTEMRTGQCIKVDSPTSTYIAGRGWHVTHNTFWLATELIRRAWYKTNRYGSPLWPSDGGAPDVSGWMELDWRGLATSFQMTIVTELFKRLQIVNQQGGLASLMIKQIRRTPHPMIELINGSVIDFGTLSDGGQHVEAVRRQLIVVDEVGHVPDFRTVYESILAPRMLGVGGHILTVGTPKETTDPWLYDLKAEAERGSDFYAFMEGSSLENPYWDEREKLDVMKNPSLFNSDGSLTQMGLQVIEGKFLLAGGMFFDRGTVFRMFAGEHNWYTAPQGASVHAWDIAGSKKGGDATVGLSLDLSSYPWKVNRLDHIPAGSMPWADRFDLICERYEEDRPAAVAVDVTGAASDSVSAVLAERGLPIIEVNFSGSTGSKKYDMLRGLQSAMESDWTEGDRRGRGYVRFPSQEVHPELKDRRKEFDFYRLDDRSLTTDTVMCLGMAAKVAAEIKPQPIYNGGLF